MHLLGPLHFFIFPFRQQIISSPETMSTSVAIKVNAASPSEKKTDGEVFGTWKRRPSIISDSNTDEEKPNPASLLKRRSTFKGIATGLLSMRRMTKGRISISTAPEEVKPKIRLENTYKTDPDEGKEFRAMKVEDVVSSILEKELCNENYEKDRCKNLACDLSVMIKNRVKKMGFPRYRIICNVIIGQSLEQGVEMASQCIWSPSTDNFSCSSYRNGSLFAVATVHAVYYE
ncbi:dynein light chain Tctex-type 5-B-like [Mytilus trossulus]|uniref:dynein light chain Tctex-type 5-B-like n=1 Tax=Mytilus trossulus TaxID=6551 RepID=UPI0030053021